MYDDDEDERRARRKAAIAAETGPILARIAQVRAEAERHRYAADDLLRAIRPQLREMAARDSEPLIREMARDLADGNITPAQAIGFGPYAEILRERTDRFASWYRELGDEDRDRLSELGREWSSRTSDGRSAPG